MQLINIAPFLNASNFFETVYLRVRIVDELKGQKRNTNW